jgi:hypothetical protein
MPGYRIGKLLTSSYAPLLLKQILLHDQVIPIKLFQILYASQMQIQKARECPHCYRIRQEISGDEADDTIGSLGLLASVLQGQGKYEAAEEMNRRALSGGEKALCVGHPDTLTSICQRQ